MPLPQSLLDAVEAHPCFAGCYAGRADIQVCCDPARPLERTLVVQCQDCLSFYAGTLPSLLPAGMTSSQLAHVLSRHVTTQRGIAMACSGYHTQGPGFWLHAAYYPCGLFLLDGASSRKTHDDLELLLMAFQHGVIAPPDPRMLDRKQYATHDVFLDRRVPLGRVTSRVDLALAPQIQWQTPSGSHWRQVTLAEYLPLSQPPRLGKPVVPVPIVVPVTSTPKPTTKRPLRVGDICPVCHAEVRERPLLNGTYVGCLC